jgi:hypothetical protein
MNDHPHPLIQAALRRPRAGDEPPPELLAGLIAQAPAPELSRREAAGWAAAPLAVGALLAAWLATAQGWALPLPSLTWCLPLAAAAALHAAWPRRPA